MATHDSALSALAARLGETDSTLSTALVEIVTTAVQELVEADLTAFIGAEPGERTHENQPAQRASPEAVVDPRLVISS